MNQLDLVNAIREAVVGDSFKALLVHNLEARRERIIRLIEDPVICDDNLNPLLEPPTPTNNFINLSSLATQFKTPAMLNA